MDAGGDSVLRPHCASERAVRRMLGVRHRVRLHLQVELTSILRDFPACLAYFAVFGACLIQHGIRVVDMDIDFTWTTQSRQLVEAALFRRHGDVSHLPRGLPTSL